MRRSNFFLRRTKMRLFVIIVTAIFTFFCTIRTITSSESSPEKETIKRLPIGIIDCARILSGKYVYVDKTNSIMNLIQHSSKFVFLSRPRQFGKSLLLSTLEEIFKGRNKELFKNTSIYTSSYEWTEYPVVRIDFSRIPRNFPKDFLDTVQRELNEQGRMYGIADQSTPNITYHCVQLLNALNHKFGKPVVVLFNEYDCTGWEKHGLPQGQEAILKQTRTFYNALRSLSEIIRFCFIIAVPPFSEVSAFSAFDEMGLVDVSSEPDYHEIAGFTMDEIKSNFRDHIEAIAAMDKVATEFIYNEIKSWYPGHNFSKEDVPVYGPHSVLTYLHFKNASDIFGFRWGTNWNMNQE